MKPYYLFKPWVRWLPMPILVWIAKRKFESVIWYQDKDVVIQMERIFRAEAKNQCGPALQDTLPQ